MPPVSEVEIAMPEEGAGGLSRSDCLCPVCLEIFLEPVTLPCSHTFCKACFMETVDKANMCCPLCRKRVSTWARLNSRNKTLVNKDLWQRIQNAFPEQCQRRISGQEDDYSTLPIATPKVCQPGELRREYEDEVSKIEKERQAQEEAERQASEEYIQRLLAEDEQRLAEERRRQEESQQKDEWLARQISQELNSDSVSNVNSQPIEISPPQKKKPSAGDIQKFFCPVRNKHTIASDSSPTSSLLANKENIRNLEISLLSPARGDSSAGRNLPTLDYYGPLAHGSQEQHPDLLPSPPCSPSSISSSFTSSNDFEILDITSPEKSASTSSSAKRKNEVMEEEEGERSTQTLTPKRPCVIPSEPSTSAAMGPSLLQQLTQQEEELQERRRQEEEDRQLALRLQREMDREERIRATDRSKSSTDPYQLRQKTPRRSATAGTAGDNEATPLTPHSTRRSLSTQREDPADQGKAPKRRQSAPPAAPAASAEKISATPASATTTTTPTAAASSAATPVKKGSKQITITHLFSSWGR